VEHPSHEVDFLVLHALRIKGFASADVVAEVVHMNPAVATAALQDLLSRGFTKFFESRNLWQMTPEGKAAHVELLPSRAAVAGDLRPPYPGFLELNEEFKQCCAAWQTRDGAMNDHTDATYDAARVADLRRLHERSGPALDAFAGAVPRFAGYLIRLEGALARVEAGESKMFTGVMCGSYHDIWMELHEDLIQMLGVDRTAEGSF
jgi:hypothetical protein